MIKLDKWQQEVLDHDGDLLLCTGRRVGKTYILARKAIDLMARKPGTPIVIISLTEDQAMIIMSMALNYAKERYPQLIGKGKDKPTLKSLHLNRGKMIIRPVGNTGDGARGFEGGVLIVDEASRVPKLFWIAALPILLTTNGKLWLGSTPFGKEGYFWERYNEAVNLKLPEARFKVFKISTEEAVKQREISYSWTEQQRDGAIRILAEDKRTMSSREYMQEYGGEFIDELMSFFPEELVNASCILDRGALHPEYKYYLGVDVGGLGDDVSTFEIMKKINKDLIVHHDSQITRRTYTTDTIKRIKDLENDYHFRKIGIDNAGLGAGVFHSLLFESTIKNRIVGLNNASKDLDREGKKKASLLKEDMYMMLRALMEQGKVRLLKDEKVIHSLRSMQQEIITDSGVSKLRIFGSDSHISEGLVRAAWIAAQDKTLNIWAA